MKRLAVRGALALMVSAGAAAVWILFASAAGAGGTAHRLPAEGLARSPGGIGRPMAAIGWSASNPFGTMARGPLPLGLDHRLGPLVWSAAGPYSDGKVLVGFRQAVPSKVQHALEARAGAIRARALGPAALLTVPLGRVPAVLRRLRRDAAVRYAEPDYVLEASGVPNDPQFGLQWPLWNTGQTVNGIQGTPNVDERAMPAWDVTTGSSSIVIAETDTGVEYTHPDLATNIWSNPGGIGGCPSGTHGFNVLAGESGCDPMDTDTAYGGHGTHIAGIMGAVGNNNTGISGVNRTASILPVKWLDSNSAGLTSDLINALQTVIKAKQAGVNIRVVNDSITFVGTAYSQALSDEIDQLGANNILFVTAAGNTSANNDVTPRYPCDYDRPNEICVAASDQNDALPSWANYGATTVDLAAPGNNIYSTLRNASYGYISGSSMAAAEVSGAAALILSAGGQSATALKADILNHVDPVASLSGLVRTGGRLDICKALPGCTVPPPSYTLGKTGVGGSVDSAGADYKRANEYTLSTNATISKLTVWLQPTSVSGTQPDQGVIYADANGAPGSLIAVSNPVTFSSSNSPGWYDLAFPTPVQLIPGTYWIGFISGSTSGVTGLAYDWVSGDRAYNSNSYASGPSDPFGPSYGDGEQMSLYATYTVPVLTSPPTNTAAPSISGTPQVGATLSSSNGSWTGFASNYRYQWERCDASGGNCATLYGATSPTYAIAQVDAGSTLRVAVTASNSVGPSTALSPPTKTVQAMPTGGTFGNTNVGAYSDQAGADYKRANEYALSTAATVTKLTAYFEPTWVGGTQEDQGVIYADANGSPGSLMAVTTPLTFSSSQAAGWYDLPFATPLQLARGNYWIGFISGASSYVTGLRYDYVPGSRAYNANPYSSGASNPFGSSYADGEQMSLYATYTTAPPPAPTNSNPPTITGSAQVGQTLSAATGTWTGSPSSYGYRWERCDPQGNNCAAIAGATGPTYAVARADAASTLVVVVTAFNLGGAASAASAATVTVPQVPPANTAPPVISGTVQDGQTLTASSGTWDGASSYSYQWQRCDAAGGHCAAISGATAQSYTLGDADVGSRLEVVVTASNVAGSTAVASAATASVQPVAPTVRSAPAISGKASVGYTLSASNGDWNGSPSSYAYQWDRCDVSANNCAAISGATNQAYTVANADVGSTLKVAVTASNSAGNGSSTSAPTATVILEAPTSVSAPTLSGNPVVGHALSASTGSWTGSPDSYGYQWERCDPSGNNCTGISGATANSYTVGNADVGSTLEVAVKASNTAGSGSATSTTTATVATVPPSNTAAPKITGSSVVGQTLTADHGTWSGWPSSYAYQWERCDSSGNNCATITGATDNTYVVANADVGSTLELAVTAANPVGSATASSAPTGIVPPVPPSNSSPPTISGNVLSGQSLTATTGTWAGTSPTYGYQWHRCDASGTNCAAISGATSQTYSITTYDVGSTLKVAVKASNAAGSATATSALTQTVTAAPPATFGTTSVGPNSDNAGADRKRVNEYALGGNGTVAKLDVYLQPTAASGSQALEGVIYADSGGAPGALIAVSNQLTFNSTEAAGWYDLPFAAAVHLAAGNYWLGLITGATYGVAGFRWTSVAGARAINSNPYTSGPSDPFGPFTTDSERISLYATYTPG